MRSGDTISRRVNLADAQFVFFRLSNTNADQPLAYSGIVHRLRHPLCQARPRSLNRLPMPAPTATPMPAPQAPTGRTRRSVLPADGFRSTTPRWPFSNHMAAWIRSAIRSRVDSRSSAAPSRCTSGWSFKCVPVKIQP